MSFRETWAAKPPAASIPRDVDDPGIPPTRTSETKRVVWRLVRLTTGWSLLVLGIIGLFLPVLQGILFIASGLAILSTESAWAKRLLERISEWRKRRRGSAGGK